MRKIVFTRRAMLGIRQALGMTSVHAISQPFSSLFGSMVDGAQLGVLLNMPAPHQFPGHPAYRPAGPIRLEAHVCAGALSSPAWLLSRSQVLLQGQMPGSRLHLAENSSF